MSSFTLVITAIIVFWIVARTISFALWNWRYDNKAGSVMVIIVCLAVVLLPIYIIFIKT